MKGIKKIARQEQMFELAGQYFAGTKSVNEISLEYKISPTTFRYWIRKYQSLHNKANHQNNSRDNFLPIHVIRDYNETEVKMEIFYPNGVGIKVPIKTDPGLVRSLITMF